MLTITAVAIALSLARTTGSQATGAYVSAFILAVISLATTMPTFGFLLRSRSLLKGILYAALYHSCLVPVAFSVLKLYVEPPPKDAWLFFASLFSFWGGLTGTTVVIGVMLRDAGYQLTAVKADAVDSKRELPEPTPQQST
jgi:hypothetical protein